VTSRTRIPAPQRSTIQPQSSGRRPSEQVRTH
jgi:hypothetical protein